MINELDFKTIYDNIIQPTGGDNDKARYAAMPVAGYEGYLIGKDRESHACLLVVTSDYAERLQAPIHLESLSVQFALRCQLKKGKESESEGIFNVIRCTSLDQETIRYFLSICETVVRMVGNKPTQQALATVVHHLTTIFQKLVKPPTREVNGLFGELYLIWRSTNPVRTVSAWRNEDIARFDFSIDNIRIDVKTTTGRIRVHTFSYEQCNPSPGTIAVVASLFVEKSTSGISLRSLIKQIEGRIAGHYELVMKLYEVVSLTLGKNLNESLELSFDIKPSDSSLCFFSLHEVPAIREPLPVGISNVHFSSNLSLVHPLPIQKLVDQDPTFRELLPIDHHVK